VETGALLKMAVFNRYGKDQHGLALIDGMDGVTGAMALTYGHDAHNLTVYGGNDEDMALAANAVIAAHGGLCTAQGGQIRTLVPLPIAGLLSEETPERLLQQQEQLLADCRDMGFAHARLLSFFTLMPLAVSPEIKCTDHGLLDVVSKQFLPLIEQIKEGD
jgi:adenine deaminase